MLKLAKNLLFVASLALAFCPSPATHAGDITWDNDTRAYFRFFQKEAEKLGYAAGFPTFSVRPAGDDVVVDYHGAVFLKQDAVVIKTISEASLVKVSGYDEVSWKSIMRGCYELAREDNFIGAYPNGGKTKDKNGDDEYSVVFIKNTAGYREDIKLKVFEKAHASEDAERWNALRDSAKDSSKTVGGFLNSHAGKKGLGTIWIRRGFGDSVWVKK